MGLKGEKGAVGVNGLERDKERGVKVETLRGGKGLEIER